MDAPSTLDLTVQRPAALSGACKLLLGHTTQPQEPEVLLPPAGAAPGASVDGAEVAMAALALDGSA